MKAIFSKILLLGLLGLLIPASLFGQRWTVKRDDSFPAGKVRTFKQVVYPVFMDCEDLVVKIDSLRSKPKNPNSGIWLYSDMKNQKFNENGQIVEEIECNHLWKPPACLHLYSYDSLGQLILHRLYNAKDSLVQKDTFIFRYNKQGKLAEYIKRDMLNDSVKWRTTYRYAKKRGLSVVMEKDYYGFDELMSTTVKKYNKQGKRVFYEEKEWWKGKLEYYEKELTVYNEDGKAIEFKVYEGKRRKLAEVVRYEYDERGRTARYYSGDSEQNIYLSEVYEYNENQKIVNSYDFKGNLMSRSVEEYNEMGDKKKSTLYYPNGHICFDRTYHYQYDSKGNWIERLEYYNGEPTYVIKREIEYYE